MIVFDDTDSLDSSDISTATYSDILLEEDEEQLTSYSWGGDLQLEQQLFTRSESLVDQLQFLHLDVFAYWQINQAWNLKLGARLDGNYQHGTNKSNDTQLDYTDTYLRYRDEKYRLTLGAQTIHWGRMDNFSPTDRLAVVDLSRGVLPDWGENYRSSAAIRAEIFLDQSKLDLVYVPKFRAAELSETDQPWYPINFYEGRVLGFAKDPLMSSIIKNTKINDDYSRKDGMSLRYSSSVNSVDYALSAQYIQLSMPYFHYNSNFIDRILYEEHPENLILGADTAFEWKAITWRFEAAWLSDMPATNYLLEYDTYHGAEWAAGLEFYPGDSDTRVNMQLSGKHLFNKEKIIDRDNVLSLSGEFESEFDNGKWVFSTRYSLGLDIKDVYISPKVSYLGFEPYKFYAAYHYLEGAEQSVGDFYKNNKLLNFGLSVKH